MQSNDIDTFLYEDLYKVLIKFTHVIWIKINLTKISYQT